MSALHAPDFGTDAAGLFPLSAVGDGSVQPPPLSPHSSALAQSQAHDADTVYSRGVLYATATGAARDEAKARACFERAASLGHAQAAYKLGSMYESGTCGVAQNWAEAGRLYYMAAAGGDADAMCSLAVMYSRGLGGMKRAEISDTDDAEAVRYYALAAERGHVRGMVALADALIQGVGVARDYARAEAWLQQASDLGYEIAMLRLGAHLERTDQSPLGLRRACAAYERAIALGCANAHAR